MFSQSNHLLMCLSSETLTSIIRTGSPILMELIDLVNSIIIFLSQMTLLRWLTILLGSQTVILIVLFLWIYFSLDSSICSTMAFPLFGNSDHLVVSISIDFPSNSQRDSPFHHIAYDYSRADWDSFCGHYRDVPCKDIFKLGASAASSEFCEWVQVGMIYISLIEISGQASLISLVFSCLCCCLISKKSLFSFLSKG